MAEDSSGKNKSDIVTLNDEERVGELLRDSIMGLWDVVNNLTRLRATRRKEFRVTIFGSARISRDHWVYGAVRDLARELASMGCAIVTGGGPGLMEAANEGAAQAGLAPGNSVGIRVHLPFEQEINPFVHEAFAHRTFFSRLHHFVLVSDAFVVVPGGIGTLLELSMIWQLLQVRNLEQTPLILVGRMWADLVAWARGSMLRPESELASPEDLEIPRCVDTAEQAMTIIREHHEQWRQRQAQK
ncbi:MAG TPA: LOG family protein [Candidatus Binataceae bacterium]|nr:LOG family protein [Candidatus Binataceae bacterium]